MTKKKTTEKPAPKPAPKPAVNLDSLVRKALASCPRNYYPSRMNIPRNKPRIPYLNSLPGLWRDKKGILVIEKVWERLSPIARKHLIRWSSSNMAGVIVRCSIEHAAELETLLNELFFGKNVIVDQGGEAVGIAGAPLTVS